MSATHYPQSILHDYVVPAVPSINVGGRLMLFDRPCVMGILNATPDSFYADSRGLDNEGITRRVRQMVSEGADIIDVGACSTRPGSTAPSEDEEWARLDGALQIVRSEAPDVIVSVDTYRSSVARRSIEQHGVHIVNDISGGTMDSEMFATVADLHVPYVLTHMQGTPADMQNAPMYDNVVVDVTRWLAERVDALHQLGVADVIIDPGFGFGKTLQHNYQLLHNLQHLRHELPDCALMVGLSRKSMICQVLGCSPAEALNGTTVLNTIALMQGAQILRVHDVKETVETVALVSKEQ